LLCNSIELSLFRNKEELNS